MTLKLQVAPIPQHAITVLTQQTTTVLALMPMLATTVTATASWIQTLMAFVMNLRSVVAQHPMHAITIQVQRMMMVHAISAVVQQQVSL
jgi:hypothetical protein